MKPTGPTNPYLRKLIEELKKKSKEFEAPIWAAVAEKLGRPRRKKVEVNVIDIERHAKENETVVVPGVVLSYGELSKPVKVAAWRFSQKAKEKIEKAGGKCMSIEELVNENPRGSNVRILT
ncbi:MAG: 50S ribosomal protein L18e [Candidatus Aenigmarchaeota archaeon]|nr:50S ribosomal protein L18e [Candidatus Aenigmarchaeota archaeon]